MNLAILWHARTCLSIVNVLGRKVCVVARKSELSDRDGTIENGHILFFACLDDLD